MDRCEGEGIGNSAKTWFGHLRNRNGFYRVGKGRCGVEKKGGGKVGEVLNPQKG